MTNPIIEEWLTEAGGLAERLRQARVRAGVTGKAVADAIGWAQSKVSRLENGKQAPTPDDITALAGLYGLDESTRQYLIGRLEELEEQRPTFRQRLRGGRSAIQAAHTRLVENAAVIRNFETVVVPGMLQTPDYYRHLIQVLNRVTPPGKDDTERAVAERMRRGQLVYDTSKRFEFLIAEPVLRWRYGPAAVMRAQLDRLHGLVDALPNVRLGIIPLGAVRTVPVVGFLVLDNDTAIVEEWVSESKWTGERGTEHAQIMDQLWEDAAEGSAALDLITAAMGALPPD